MFKSLARLSTLSFVTVLMLSAETVTVRSGNGSIGGRDSAVTFLLGPAAGNFSHAFTSADFASAQTGPAAFVLGSLGNAWIPGLSADPSAKWIGSNPNSGGTGNTALYAVSFQITNPFVAASMQLTYAADDVVGEAAGAGPNTGVYLNGAVVCGNAFAVGFSQATSVTCSGVGPMLHVGTNWLYIEDGNAVGAAGLLFSATITTTAPGTSTVTVRGGNGSIGGTDHAVTFLKGPADSDFPNAFTSADFANAQNGPSAFVLSSLGNIWIPGLSEDSSAHWIGTSASAYAVNGNGATGLYAVGFQIPNPFTSATLSLHYAVDDNLGGIRAGGINSGVYLNGTAVCANLVPVGTFAREQTFSCNDIGPVLTVGKNWLYLDAVNLQGAAGLLFSATITTTDAAAGPSINSAGVVSAASYSPGGPVAPGSIAAVFGNLLVGSPSSAPGLPLPTSMAGIAFQIGSDPIPMFFVSSGQADIQIPWELAGQSTASISASVNGQVIAPQTVNLSPFAPGIFSTSGNGQGQGAILNASYQIVDSSHPALAGDVIQIYSTGLGPVTNQPATGSPAGTNPLSATTTVPSATIGGVQAPVLFSGLTPGDVGLYQVNVQVPAGTTGNAVPVVISISGFTSNTVTIAVQTPVVPVPPVPTGLSPGSNAPPGVTVNTLTPTLSWNASPGATAYIVVIVNNSTGANAAAQTLADQTSIISPTLTNGMTYAWTVGAYNSSGPSAISTPLYFTVATQSVPPSFTGTWQGTWASTKYISAGSLSANLTQSGTNVTGTVSFSGSPCFVGGTVSGTASGNTLPASIAVGGGQTVSLTATVNATNTSILGNYALKGGTCLPAGDAGIFILSH